MPQSTKEWVLNYTANRWGLNKKRKLGSISDSIRTCQPRSKEEWTNYYYSNIRSREEIDELGRSWILLLRMTVLLIWAEQKHLKKKDINDLSRILVEMFL